MTGQSDGSLGTYVVLGAVLVILAAVAWALWPYAEQILGGLTSVAP